MWHFERMHGTVSIGLDRCSGGPRELEMRGHSERTRYIFRGNPRVDSEGLRRWRDQMHLQLKQGNCLHVHLERLDAREIIPDASLLYLL